MNRYRFEVHRSNDDEDQALGVTCSNIDIVAYMDGKSLGEVREFARRLMVIPGVYSLRIRGSMEREWHEFGPYDTRTAKHKNKPKKRPVRPKLRREPKRVEATE